MILPNFLAAVTLPNLLALNLGPLPWLVWGLIMLGCSLFIPSPTIVAFGFSGLLTALVAINISPFPSQLLIWGILSGVFTLMLRGLVPRESEALEPAKYARVCEAIQPGQVGHVHYEGVVWKARCQISDVAIAIQSPVVVVDRQGNTLIVLPIPNSPSNIR